MSDANPDERFFNFKPETLALIGEFQRTRKPALVSPVLHGILEKYLPEGERLPAGATPEETLNAFGFESLTLIEVVLDLQDALGITLSDEEMRGMHNLEEVRALLTAKVAALGAAP